MKIFTGLVIGIATTIIIFYLLVMAGIVTVIGEDGNFMVMLFNLAKDNLGYSMPLFLMTLVMFVFYLWQLTNLVKIKFGFDVDNDFISDKDNDLSNTISDIIDAESKVDLMINLFFRYWSYFYGNRNA